MTLLETLIAVGVLSLATTGIMGIAAVGTLTTENQGNLGSRTAEYAQDKMEQLIALSYNDATTDTTQFPACGPPACTSGTGLGGAMAANTSVGSYDPTAPTNGYVDYLDWYGTPVAIVANVPGSSWYYMRVWKITTLSGNANLKQITVTAKVRYSLGVRQVGILAQSTVSTLKSNPF